MLKPTSESWASRISYFSTSLLRVSNCAGLHGLNGKLHTDSARCIVIDHLSKEKRIWKRLETALSKSDAELLSLNNSAIVPRLRGVHEYSEGATIPKHQQLGRGKADRDRSVLGRRRCRSRATDGFEIPERLARQHTILPAHPEVRRYIQLQ